MTAAGVAQLRDFGPSAEQFQIDSGTVWVVRSAEHIPLELRARAFSRQAKDIRYYEISEKSLSSQFDHRYLIIHDAASDEWLIQPFFIVDQDILAGSPRGWQTFIGKLRKAWPRFLSVRMLMIGCSSAEGHLDHDAPWAVDSIRQAVDWLRARIKPSIVLFKDFPAKYRGQMDGLTRHGYQRVPGLPAADLKLDFQSFEEFMAKRLSKPFRKNLRRKFRAGDSAPPITMEAVTDVPAIIDEIFPLYRQTFLRSRFRFEELNRDYFLLMAERMPDRARYFAWRMGGRIVAFSLCLVHEGTLHDLDVGLDYSVALDLHLYFVTWRDIVEWCLKNGITTYHTGPLNYDPKAHLRFSLAPQDLYARHNSGLLNPLFKIAMKFLQPARHEPLLKKFHNAHEL